LSVTIFEEHPVYADLLAQFEEYLVATDLAPATITNYLADLRRFAQWWAEAQGENVSLLAVTADNIRRYRRDMARWGWSPATINRRLQGIRKFFSFAVTADLLSVNPAAEVSRVNEQRFAPSRILTQAELGQFLVAVRNNNGSQSRRDYALLQVLVETGIKVSELVDLRLEDVELGVGEGYLLVGNSLATGGRCLSIGPAVCAALRNYLRVRAPAPGVTHLFLNREGRPISPRTVQRLVSTYARAAGLTGVSAHTLRQTFAYTAMEEGGNPQAVARLLGLRGVPHYVRGDEETVASESVF
jgi:site-specific recombinase XerD